MFDPEFYPTPANVAHDMCALVDIQGKVVLEPHAGKGDLINIIKEYNPKEILSCEKNRDLASICSNISTFIGDDALLLSKEDIAHVDIIIANPPFSMLKHIYVTYGILRLVDVLLYHYVTMRL